MSIGYINKLENHRRNIFVDVSRNLSSLLDKGGEGYHKFSFVGEGEKTANLRESELPL